MTPIEIAYLGGLIIFILGNIIPHLIWRKHKKLASRILWYAVIPLDIVIIITGVYSLIDQ